MVVSGSSRNMVRGVFVCCGGIIRVVCSLLVVLTANAVEYAGTEAMGDPMVVLTYMCI